MESHDRAVALSFHHVGMVVKSVEEASEYYCNVLGYRRDGCITEDRVQRVRILFLRLGGFAIELLEPMSENSPISRFLAASGGIQHICYACQDIKAALQGLIRTGAAIACAPVAAPAIDGHLVAFVVNRQRQLIELVEMASPQPME